MSQRKLPNFSEERKLWARGFKFVGGVDEVGRGAWAGPLVAAAVIWQRNQNFQLPISNDQIKIDDSKRLKPRQREKAAQWIKENALAWGIGEIPASTINRLGMAKATKQAFRKAIKQLSNKDNKTIRPDFLLIDAFYIPYIKGLRRKRQKAIIDGDEKSISIAAASILAKVYRDKLMKKLGRRHKVYGWARNKGYGTRQHQRAIKKHGLTRYHRKAFVETWKEKKGA